MLDLLIKMSIILGIIVVSIILFYIFFQVLAIVSLDAEIEFIKSIISDLNKPIYLTDYEYDEELVKSALEKLANHWQTLEEAKDVICLEIGKRHVNAERDSE